MKFNHLTFSLTLPADDEIIDIFSTDIENPCSLSLGNFTITNYNPKTYSISVEVKNDSITNGGACGAQVSMMSPVLIWILFFSKQMIWLSYLQPHNACMHIVYCFRCIGISIPLHIIYGEKSKKPGLRMQISIILYSIVSQTFFYFRMQFVKITKTLGAHF